MKIKNLKIGKKLKTLAPYVLIGTLSFAGVRHFAGSNIGDTMPVYEVETIDSNGKHEIKNFTKEMFTENWSEEPTNKIVEYKNYIKDDGTIKKYTTTYETDAKYDILEYAVTSGEDMARFFNYTDIEEETIDISDVDINVKIPENYVKAEVYDKVGKRELTEKEQAIKEEKKNLFGFGGSIPLDMILFCMYYWLNNSLKETMKKQKEKTLKR